ncbi:hypothetical protein [Nocardia sp. CDC160]|uniref:hypothetical protein n=1 Tax=Nocardia sp. CDC160 TaxID=3112166 RepID=UPI002DBFB16B|nr:hypothetical protein [Nocardia sp. CDC160]MEC3920667.1 hypothetical protein [Nocardia sp. CDC160]
MTEVVKVFTPIKRVPTMIGKAPNGQKLPFGPYTLHQAGGAVVLIALTSGCTMVFPINPAVTFVIGVVFTALAVFALGLVPYTGVRTTSRVLWIARVITRRKPVYASGMPIDAQSVRHTAFIEQSLVVVLPESQGIRGAEASIGQSRRTMLTARSTMVLEVGTGLGDPAGKLNLDSSFEGSLG